MLSHHWLDDVFADPSKAKEALLGSEGFQNALKAAIEAHDEHLELIRELYHVKGLSAAQAARVVFINLISSGKFK